MALHQHFAAGSIGIIDHFEHRPPGMRSLARIGYPKSSRHAGADSERFEAADIVAHFIGIPVDVFARNLEDTRAQVAHHAHELLDFVPVREPARYRASIGSLMRTRTRSRKSSRTRTDRGVQFGFHRRELLGAGLLVEGSLAHN